MAKCEYCDREMQTAEGCSLSHIKIGKKWYEREKGNIIDEARCPDCSASLGGYHHFGCDNERCPKCSLQLISCDCNKSELWIKK